MKVYHLLAAILCAAPLSAQLVTDATYSVRMTSQPNRDVGVSGLADPYNVSISVGWMRPLSSRVSIGAVGTLGAWGESYVGVAPRLSLSPSPTTAINITPTLLLYRAGEPGNTRALLDLSVMHRDRVGLSFQATTFRQFDFHPDPQVPRSEATRTMLFGGLRLGQKPGRYGILADAIALGAAIVVVLIACGGGNCS